MSWAATRFDGRAGTGETVLVRLDGDTLAIVARGAIERHPLRTLAIAETFDRAPAMIALPGGGTLEIPDPERTLSAALSSAGVRPSWIVRLQSMWMAVLLALACLIGGAVWAYVEGVPIAARSAAQLLPAAWERALGERALALVDSNLRRSTLPAEDRARIEASFRQAAATVAPGVDVRLLFRAGGVNAFALPGGTIVIFDGIVQLADNDDRVLGVLGHELGHVVGRHPMRQLLQAVGLVGFAAFVWSDFSTVAANIPVILGTMRYGRAFENEADAFSVEFMRRTGRPVAALRDMFVRLQETDRSGGSLPEFLSTHPGTDARIEWLDKEIEKDAASVPGETSVGREKSR